MFCSFSLCLGKIVTNFLPWMAASKTREWQCTLAVHKPNDLPLEDQELLSAAHEAAAKAYAPYSNFQVGGAVRLADGVIVKGSNQENMAYPSGMCGERVAVFAAGAQHPGQIMTTLAIVSPSMQAISEAFMPCGGCRQKIREFGTAETQILICDESGLRQTFTLDGLLPHSFGPDNLNR